MSWLPTQVTPPMFDPSALKLLLFGRPKIGKSTWAASFPDTLVVATEEGHGHLSLKRVSVDSWSMERWVDGNKVIHCGCLELLTELEDSRANKELPFKSLIIDTADQLFKMCNDFVCEELGVTHVGDTKNWGKGHDALANEFRRAVLRFTRLGCGVVFISHTKTNSVLINDTEVEKHDVTLPNKAKEVLLPLVDLMLRCDYATNMETGDTHRVIVSAGSQHATAGSRWSLPEQFPMTIRGGYDKLLSYLKDPESAPKAVKQLQINKFKIKK